MRAATAIVGAIAVASILVALSLIVSGGGDSGKTVVTKTVIEKVEAPAKKEAKEEPEAEAEGTGGGAQFGGPTSCGTELGVENTSCEVGEGVHAAYLKSGEQNLSVTDPETGATVAFLCKDETTPVTCRDAEGATVYFEP
jgi:hypothetical protein